jgi:hypothetical protein
MAPMPSETPPRCVEELSTRPLPFLKLLINARSLCRDDLRVDSPAVQFDREASMERRDGNEPERVHRVVRRRLDLHQAPVPAIVQQADGCGPQPHPDPLFPRTSSTSLHGDDSVTPILPRGGIGPHRDGLAVSSLATAAPIARAPGERFVPPPTSGIALTGPRDHQGKIDAGLTHSAGDLR